MNIASRFYCLYAKQNCNNKSNTVSENINIVFFVLIIHFLSPYLIALPKSLLCPTQNNKKRKTLFFAEK